MRTQTCKMVLALAALGLAALGPLYGQSEPPLRVTVPFDFYIGTESLSAGDYLVSPASRDRVVLKFHHTQSNRKVMVNTISAHAGTKPVQPKLVFHRYGDQYFLTQVWITPGPAGNELAPSKAERALRKTDSSPQWVSVPPKGPKSPYENAPSK